MYYEKVLIEQNKIPSQRGRHKSLAEVPMTAIIRDYTAPDQFELYHSLQRLYPMKAADIQMTRSVPFIVYQFALFPY